MAGRSCLGEQGCQAPMSPSVRPGRQKPYLELLGGGRGKQEVVPSPPLPFLSLSLSLSVLHPPPVPLSFPFQPPPPSVLLPVSPLPLPSPFSLYFLVAQFPPASKGLFFPTKIHPLLLNEDRRQFPKHTYRIKTHF